MKLWMAKCLQIGLILAPKRMRLWLHYALGGLNNKVFASRYKLQLPDPEILRCEIEAERRRLTHKVAPERKEKPHGRKDRD